MSLRDHEAAAHRALLSADPANQPAKSTSSTTECHGRLHDGLNGTFFAMERRRVKRATIGRLEAKGFLGSLAESVILFVIVWFILSLVPRSVLPVLAGGWSNIKMLLVPIFVTLALAAQLVYQTFMLREHVALYFMKAWLWLFIIWGIYSAAVDDSPSSHMPQPNATVFSWPLSPSQMVLGRTAVSLEAVTFAAWVLYVLVHPKIVNLCSCRCAHRLWWGIRTEPPGETASPQANYSYMPWGRIFCLVRRHFRYSGEVASDGVPHGLGIWQCNDYHGEVLKGHWVAGLPEAPFVSRGFGRGAVSTAVRVGYASARAEGFNGLHLLPKASEELRWGLVSIECSVAGAFQKHLPQTLSQKPVRSAAEALGGLREAAELFESLQELEPGADLEAQDEHFGHESLPDDPPSNFRSLSASLPIGALERSTTAAPPLGQTAIVLVHGYNCTTKEGCMRIAQLLALGKFKPNYMPFVYSWPTGAHVAFLETRRRIPRFAAELATFLQELRRNGVQEVHLLAHSLGCELLTAALPQLLELTQAKDGLPALDFPTVSLINATNPCKSFFEAQESDRSEVSQLCRLVKPRRQRQPGRVTLYCDQEDKAIGVAEVFGRCRAVGRGAPRVLSETPLPQAFRDMVDVIDCSAMDANVHAFRHSYYDLNTSVVGDIEQLISTGKPASRRNRLLRLSLDNHTNVFSFLAPPVFLKN